MLCGHHLAPRPSGRFQLMMDRIMARLTSLYVRTLDIALGKLWLSLAVTVAAAALSIHLFQAMPKGQLPEDDAGLLWGWSVAAQDASFDVMRQLQTKAVAIIRDDPASLMSFPPLGRRVLGPPAITAVCWWC